LLSGSAINQASSSLKGEKNEKKLKREKMLEKTAYVYFPTSPFVPTCLVVKPLPLFVV